MISALAAARVNEHQFHSENPVLPFNTRLMNYISYQMSENRGFVEGKILSTRVGSVAQLVANVLDDY